MRAVHSPSGRSIIRARVWHAGKYKSQVPSKKPLCPSPVLDYCPRCVDWRSRYPGPPEYTPRVLPDDKRTLFQPALLLRRATMRGDTYECARAGPSSGTPTALTAVSLFVSRKCKLRLPSRPLAARTARLELINFVVLAPGSRNLAPTALTAV